MTGKRPAACWLMAALGGALFAGTGPMGPAGQEAHEPPHRLCTLHSATRDRPTPAVSWLPAEPAQGAAVMIVVHPDTGGSRPEPIDSVVGMLAGQPLHFERGPNGRFWALSGIPIDSRESLPLTMTVMRSEADGEHVFLSMPVRRVEFPMESLRVDPRFTRPPDSALAARIAAERAQAREVSRNTHRTPRLWRGAFRRPVPDRITSPYGMGREFNGELRSRHMGVDLDADAGDPVGATNRGVVALTGDFYYAGRVVYLDHGAGLVSVYMHLSAIDVAPRDTVEAGHVIGRVGATGRVTGPHLHWTARYGTVTIDPLTLLELTPDEIED